MTPCGAHSIASCLVSAATAALLAPYAATSNSATNELSEAMLTMRPYLRSTMWRPKTCAARSVPVRLVSMMAFQSASVRSSVGTRLVRPAQLIMMSTLPKAPTASRSSVSSEARSVTSDGTRSERRPSASISFAVSSTTS